MTILGSVLFGLLVGVIAKLLMPGKDPGGFLATIAIGIIGGVVGGLIGRLTGMYGEGDPVGFVMAVIGAVILLIGYRLMTRGTTVTH